MAKRSLDEILHSFNLRRFDDTPNGYKACCDINEDHYDRSPSMHIHIENGWVKCFSCKKFMPLFDYLLYKEVPFNEAVEFLFTKFEKRDRQQLQEMKEWVLGRKIPKSLLDRGFTVATLKHFGVGYDPIENHTTIPLKYNGNLYGIGYRRYPKDFWYSDNFAKDFFIYNYEPTEERTYVEGYSDTWKSWQNGVKNTSALLTSEPSEGQLPLMAKHKIINTGFDNDLAGLVGTFKVNKMLSEEVEHRVIVYPSLDPGEASSREWLNAKEQAIPFTLFRVELIRRNRELYNQIEARLNLKKF